MNTPSKGSIVIGISSFSGGGKTALCKKLAELLGDAVVISFDDYDDSNVHPDDLMSWLASGGDYNAWKTPLLARDLELLVNHKPITSPVEGSAVMPAKYVVFDAPLGRAQRETGRFIDLMVFIDTPLDIAMARRILRNLSAECHITASEKLERLQKSLSSYLNGGRALYLEMYRQIVPTCDLVLDGSQPLDSLAAAIYERVRREYADGFPKRDWDYTAR